MISKKWNVLPPFEAPSSAFKGIERFYEGLKNVSGIVCEVSKAFEAV